MKFLKKFEQYCFPLGRTIANKPKMTKRQLDKWKAELTEEEIEDAELMLKNNHHPEYEDEAIRKDALRRSM